MSEFYNFVNLDHQNICRTYDIFSIEGENPWNEVNAPTTAVIVKELIYGEDIFTYVHR